MSGPREQEHKGSRGRLKGSRKNYSPGGRDRSGRERRREVPSTLVQKVLPRKSRSKEG